MPRPTLRAARAVWLALPARKRRAVVSSLRYEAAWLDTLDVSSEEERAAADLLEASGTEARTRRAKGRD